MSQKGCVFGCRPIQIGDLQGKSNIIIYIVFQVKINLQMIETYQLLCSNYQNKICINELSAKIWKTPVLPRSYSCRV